MFGKAPAIFSVREIKRIYPNQWVAIRVTATDQDGFAAAGELIAHDSEEIAVWSQIKLTDPIDPVYIFHTGQRAVASRAG